MKLQKYLQILLEKVNKQSEKGDIIIYNPPFTVYLLNIIAQHAKKGLILIQLNVNKSIIHILYGYLFMDACNVAFDVRKMPQSTRGG